MIEDTIKRIETEISSSESMTEDRRKALLKLLEDLKDEVTVLAETHSEEASSIAGYTEHSVREATKENINQELLKHSIDGLSLSVKQFEISHPTLVNLINNISRTLWNIGI